MSQNIVVKTLQSDRFARTAEVRINEKVIHTPNFCTLVQNERELDSLINLSMLSGTKHLGTFAVRLFDVPRIILSRLEGRSQISLTSLKSVQEPFLRFLQKSLFIVDPALEYLLYEFHANKFADAINELRTKPKQLDVLLQYIEDRAKKKAEISESEYEVWKKAFHRKFWVELDRDQAARNKFVGDYLDIETMCNAEIVIPPVPVVDSENMFDIAKGINSFTKTIAPRTKPCATYFLFQKALLSNDSLIDKVANYLRNDPTQLTIIKIKNLDIWLAGSVEQRENYKKLMDVMFEVRTKNPQKIFMALESWYVSYAAACYGYNIVSTTMTGFDRDSDYGTNTYGSWFDPDWMYYIPFDTLKDKILKNTKKHLLPCYCAVCKKIKNLSDVSKDDWYNYRREHYVLTMNEYMRQISQAITDRTIELAREKLANSQLSLLQGLVPRQEEDQT
jgi:hypothetical protein